MQPGHSGAWLTWARSDTTPRQHVWLAVARTFHALAPCLIFCEAAALHRLSGVFFKLG